MSKILNDNNGAFDAYKTSDIFFPVTKRELRGQSKDGFDLVVPEHQGVFRAREDGTPQCLGVVGGGYNPVPMHKITSIVQDAFCRTIPSKALDSVVVRDTVGRGGAYVQREYSFRALAEEITYGGQYGASSLARGHGLQAGTTVAFLARIATSYDGSSSIRLFTGSEDLVCTNGMVAARDVDAVARRHTKNAGLAVEGFAELITAAVERFHANSAIWQEWASHDLTMEQAKATVEALPGVSERRAKQLMQRVEREFADRGRNVYALVSAFTYFSSHNSEEFKVRETGQDNVAETLVRRQEEVNRWVQSAAFQRLAA